MKFALVILLIVSLVLLGIALVLWLFLLLHRLVDNRRTSRGEQVAHDWLGLLLPVLEEVEPVAHLPRIQSHAVLESVLELVGELNERFRGQYREQLKDVLVHIGGEDYGLHLVRSRSRQQRVRGCALLGWTSLNPNVDFALERCLRDADGEVRVEAAYSLSLRQESGVTLQAIMESLREGGCLESERVRDIVRKYAPTRVRELASLLTREESAREKVLLLDAISVAGDLAQSGVVAEQLTHPAPTVRAAAVLTLEKLSDPEHMEQVAALTTDTDPKVRLAVAKYSVSMGRNAGARYLLWQLAQDANFDVQRVATHGLASVKGDFWERLRAGCHQDPLLESLIEEAIEAASPPVVRS
jgi:hypothetical protein|uniref:HEAT repeat domain-containing protein n=1 Tax=Prosthecobacter sp. TaxID=1965333 RepID=UPI003785024C